MRNYKNIYKTNLSKSGAELTLLDEQLLFIYVFNLCMLLCLYWRIKTIIIHIEFYNKWILFCLSRLASVIFMSKGQAVNMSELINSEY